MLDWEDYVEIGNKNREFKKEWDEKFNGGTQETQQSQDSPQASTYDSPLALMLYIIVMVVGSIFYDRWVIWIAATLIFIWHKCKSCNKK